MINRRPFLPLFCAGLLLLTSACCLTPAGCRGRECAVPPVAAEEEAKPAVLAGSKGLKTTLLLDEKSALPPSAGAVTGVRIGDHADKTRLVLDMTSAPDSSAKIENKGRKLAVQLPGMDWAGKKSWEADSAQLISGYHLEGSTLFVDLMYPSQIRAMETLAPRPENKKHRLVIDLFSPEVHKSGAPP